MMMRKTMAMRWWPLRKMRLTFSTIFLIVHLERLLSRFGHGHGPEAQEGLFPFETAVLLSKGPFISVGGSGSHLFILMNAFGISLRYKSSWSSMSIVWMLHFRIVASIFRLTFSLCLLHVPILCCVGLFL